MLELILIGAVIGLVFGIIDGLRKPADPEKTKEDLKKAAVFLGVTTATCSRKLLKTKKHRR